MCQMTIVLKAPGHDRDSLQKPEWEALSSHRTSSFDHACFLEDITLEFGGPDSELPYAHGKPKCDSCPFCFRGGASMAAHRVQLPMAYHAARLAAQITTRSGTTTSAQLPWPARRTTQPCDAGIPTTAVACPSLRSLHSWTTVARSRFSSSSSPWLGRDADLAGSRGVKLLRWAGAAPREELHTLRFLSLVRRVRWGGGAVLFGKSRDRGVPFAARMYWPPLKGQVASTSSLATLWHVSRRRHGANSPWRRDRL